MSDIFQTDRYIIDKAPDVPQSGGGALDIYEDSTNDIVDADKIVTREDADGTWYKKTFSKVWDYIKSKIGISAQGSTGKYLDEQGNFTTPPNTTYGVVSKTANGLAPQLPNETTTTKYLRQDGTWQVPPDTNTWRPCVNALNSTATDQSLSAYQGKLLYDRLVKTGNRGYVSSLTALVSSYTAGQKVRAASFKVTQSGIYLFNPHFRSTSAFGSGNYMSCRISADTTAPQYDIAAYNDSVQITGAGSGITTMLNGCALNQLTAGTTYYVWFQSNLNGSGVGTFTWLNLIFLYPV